MKLKNSAVMKLKSLNCEETQNWNGDKIQNSYCDETQKNQIVMKLKKSKCDKIQKLKR